MVKPLQEFLRLEAAGGLILMAAAVVALLVAAPSLALGVWWTRRWAARAPQPSMTLPRLPVSAQKTVWFNVHEKLLTAYHTQQSDLG